MKSQGSDTKFKGCRLNPKCVRKQRPDTKGLGTQLAGSGIDGGCLEQARD